MTISNETEIRRAIRTNYISWNIRNTPPTNNTSSSSNLNCQFKKVKNTSRDTHPRVCGRSGATHRWYRPPPIRLQQTRGRRRKSGVYECYMNVADALYDMTMDTLEKETAKNRGNQQQRTWIKIYLIIIYVNILWTFVAVFTTLFNFLNYLIHAI